MSFNERLKKSRLSKNLTQVELANRLGISKDLYNKYERTSVRPSYETLTEIGKVLEVSTDYLLGRTGEPDQKEKSAALTTDFIEEYLRQRGVTRDKLNSLNEQQQKLLFGMLDQFLDNSNKDS